MQSGRSFRQLVLVVVLATVILQAGLPSALGQGGQEELSPPQFVESLPPDEMEEGRASGSGAKWAKAVLSDVPDRNQIDKTVDGRKCISGCGPTAAGMIMEYWDAHGYPNLISGSRWKRAVWKLNKLMRTSCAGGTQKQRISEAIERFAASRGYSGFNAQWRLSRWGRYKEEIDKGRPVLVSWARSNFKPPGCGSQVYGSHAVVGVGYRVTDGGTRYVTVQDNASCSPRLVDVPFNRLSSWYNTFFHYVDSPSQEVAIVVKEASTRDASRNHKSQFRRGDTIRLYIIAQNAGNRTVTTTWTWLTEDSTGRKINYLSWDAWTVVLAAGETDVWVLTRTYTSSLAAGKYTFTGSVSYQALDTKKHAHFWLQ